MSDSGEDEDEEGEQRPARRRRTAAGAAAVRPVRQGWGRAGSGGSRAASRGSRGSGTGLLGGFIVDDSEEEDGDAEWGAGRCVVGGSFNTFQ